MYFVSPLSCTIHSPMTRPRRTKQVGLLKNQAVVSCGTHPPLVGWWEGFVTGSQGNCIWWRQQQTCVLYTMWLTVVNLFDGFCHLLNAHQGQSIGAGLTYLLLWVVKATELLMVVAWLTQPLSLLQSPPCLYTKVKVKKLFDVFFGWTVSIYQIWTILQTLLLSFLFRLFEFGQILSQAFFLIFFPRKLNQANQVNNRSCSSILSFFSFCCWDWGQLLVQFNMAMVSCRIWVMVGQWRKKWHVLQRKKKRLVNLCYCSAPPSLHSWDRIYVRSTHYIEIKLSSRVWTIGLSLRHWPLNEARLCEDRASDTRAVWPRQPVGSQPRSSVYTVQ